MRIPSLGKAQIAFIALFVLAAISLLTASSTPSHLTIRDAAYYSNSTAQSFARPGLALNVVSASIDSTGLMTATVKIVDGQGIAVDPTGTTTPGAVPVACTMAVMPAGSNDFTSYTASPATSSTTGASSTEVWFDETGTLAPGTGGNYVYTFGVKAPSGFNAGATHRVGCSASRNLTDWGYTTYYAASTLDFIPSGGTPTTIHQVVVTAACNSCHYNLNYHGGQAIGTDLCVLCHTKVASDPTSGNSLYFPTLVHKIHMGENLPSVLAGGSYKFYGYGGAVSDFSTVAFPSDNGRCETCHDQKYGAQQATNYLLKPGMASCGACHDDVNFSTGVNHKGIVQKDDSNCAMCHIAEGDLPFDASIKGAHINPAALNADELYWVPGMIFGSLQVQNGVAGKAPTITFTLKDKAGNGIALSELATSPGRLAAVLAGPASDYGYTSFGSDQTTNGYISETVTSGGSCDGSGNCTYTFKHAIPANATGTYSIGLEGRRALVILPGTVSQQSTDYGAHNLVAYFSVDSSPVAVRRTVVSLDKCNACHTDLSLHGANRDRIEQCVMCHNPSETDASTRASAVNATDKATPAQSVDFGYMIHHIHGGADVKAYTGAGYTVVGFGGSHNDFSGVRYPVMNSTGGTGNIAYCEMCHVNNSEQNLPVGLNAVTIPQSPVNPMPRTTADCTACHATATALSHATSNTSTLGESCRVCHGPTGDWAVSKVHAQ
ncbi:MAG: OmcA/MtrC family decaheme c-type cytochrome [Bryobacteraceae bacterium]|nr:OmcA/MtrC family decaheme c-type cytochrome [Bryobacteraceae bacterium]